MKSIYIGIDIGASYIKYGFGSTVNGLDFFESCENRNTDQISLYETLIRIINKLALEHLNNRKIAAIGLGSPGIIDKISGMIISNCPNMKYWVGSKPGQILEEKFSIPVILENDADLMTYGEQRLTHRHHKTVLGVTIGTGIGCGLVSNGSIYHSNYRSALELGHTIIVDDGKLCSCGKKGCLEAYSSAASIMKRIKDETGRAFSLDDILMKYYQNQIVFTDVVNDAFNKLSQAIANTIMVLGVNIVVIGGGITESKFFDITTLAGKISRYLDRFSLDDISIESAALKNKAAVWGGITIAENYMENQPH